MCCGIKDSHTCHQVCVIVFFVEVLFRSYPYDMGISYKYDVYLLFTNICKIINPTNFQKKNGCSKEKSEAKNVKK